MVLPCVPATTSESRPSEKLLAQQGGHRGEGNALVENAFHLGIAARERVADDNQIGRGIEIGFGVGLENGNAERAKQIAHGRIGSLVRAGDAMALQLQKSGERGHGGAADSAQMNVAGLCMSCASPPVPARANCASSPTLQFGLDAKGQRHVLSRDMAAAQADGDGNIEVLEARAGSHRQQFGGAPGDAQSSISPKTMPRTPSSLPAWRSCHNMRSTW